MQTTPKQPSNNTEPVAIVGAGCRFPGAPDLDAFWQLLVDGKCATGKIPAERLELAGNASSGTHTASGFAGLIDKIAEFDCGFFGISPREARLMDPQQRMLMEVAWEAFEHAGISPQAMENTDAGVFVGISTFDYSRIQDPDTLREAHVGTGNALSIAANRLSYFFNLHGPSIAVDTACSSSLVALHLAVEHLRSHNNCQLALVGGVNAILDLGFNDTLSEAGMLSPEGKCKTFDASADGYVRSEGCGVVILKRRSQALADGDRILATVVASGTNQDGRSNGITAPNGPAQRQLLEQIYSSPQFMGRLPDYIENHGTGTPLGDPIEFHALDETLQAIAGKDGVNCLLGSVKTNVGHLEAAAGIAGVIKTALSIYHRTIPRSLHFTTPNPQLGYEESGLQVCASQSPWPAATAGKLPLAGVSSFGFGGTNAHVVLEGVVPGGDEPGENLEQPRLPILLSASSPLALHEKKAGLREYLTTHPPTHLPPVAATLAHRRSHLSHRFACMPDNHAGLVDLLAEDGSNQAQTWTGERRPAGAPALAFVFSGQGSHAPDMGKSLCQAFPELRATLLDYAGIVRRWNGPDILPDLGLGDCPPENQFPSQPAMVAYQIALALFLEKMGIVPEAVTGHSLGEISAVCISGALSPAEALRLAVLRDKAMSGASGKGKMLALLMATEELQTYLEGWQHDIDIAAQNGPEANVVSGTVEEIEQLVAKLPAHSFIPLDGDKAFHSSAMDKPSEKLATSLDWLAPGDCKIPFFSCCDSEEISGSRLDAGYWARQLRKRVCFRQTISLLQSEGLGCYVEIGARPVLQNALISSLGDPSIDVLATAARRHGIFENIARLAAALFVQGHNINWKPLIPSRYAPLPLPAYPWQGEHLWSARKSRTGAQTKIEEAQTWNAGENNQNQLMNRNAILNDLRHSVAKITGTQPDEIDSQAPFIEMGADSILLAQAAHGIQNRYGVSINLRQFFEELSNLECLADFLMEHGQDLQPSQQHPTSTTATAADGDLQSILNRQLDLLTDVMNQQMELLGGKSGPSQKNPPPRGRQSPGQTSTGQENFGPYRPANASKRQGNLTAAQQAHSDELAARLNTKLARSKERASAARLRFADCRASAGFRPSVKEMLYPVEIATADGCQLSDIDGNSYIDISMDFGVNLFGHQPDFLVKAWREQIEKGLSLSGRSPHASDVAALVCELTGMDRCAFCQSGTEAVMVAARLARLSTGRSRIAYFVNSYHGHFDGFLALPGTNGSSPVPAAPGIPEEILGDALVLEYGNPDALENLRSEAGSLAAILVEPVQSRHPDLQPGDFLRELRRIADDSGALLVFDEMITGFRIDAGGAQAYFDVRADLATYGKVLGGGQPIAAVAGRSGIMDGLDGGQWQYGDSSFPAAETTFVAGTFTGNPLALASAHALLTEIKQRGPSLYHDLNAQAKEFADSLNDWFAQEALPLRIARFGSLFRFSFTGNLDLLFYHLLEKGIFIWEGRNCFLSTAHTREDLQTIRQAVMDSCGQLRADGFIQSKSRSKPSDSEEEIKAIPATEAQRQLWVLAQMDQLANCAYSESLLIQAEGGLDADLLRQALAKVVQRHESLRTTFSEDGRQQLIHRTIATPLHTADGSTLIGAEQEAAKEAFLDEVARQPFDLKNGPLVRMGLFRLSRDTQLIAIAGHHIIFDGWSLNLLINDIAIFYSAELGQAPYPDEPAPQFSEYVEWLAETLSSPEIEQQKKFWNEKLKLPLPKLELPHDRRPPAKWSWDGARLSERISQSLRQELDALGRSSGATLFMTLLSAYQSYLHRLTGQDDLLVGCPALGRSMPGSMNMIGYLTHILPIQSHLGAGESFKTFLSRQKHDLLDILDNQTLPFADLLRQSELEWNPDEPALIHATFNLDRPREGVRLHGLKCDLLSPPIQASKFEISVNITDLGGELLLELDYNTNLLSRELAVTIRDGFINWLRKICAQDDHPLEQLSLGDRPQEKKHPMDKEFPGPFNVASIAELFSQVTENHHNEEAVVEARGVAGDNEEQKLSYAELDWRSDALAARLVAEGIGLGSVVGLGCCRGIERIVGMLGILKAGAAYMPMDSSLPDKRIELIADQAQCDLVLAESNHLERWDSLELEALPVLQELPEDMPPLPQVQRDSLAYVMFTSGSTGVPKGVAITHGNILSLMSSLHLKGNAPKGPVLHHSPASFDVSTFEMWWPLLTGRKLVIAPPGALSLRELAGTIENYSIADTFISTGIFNRLVTHESAALAGMKRVIVGGSALSPHYCKLFLDACPDTILENGYGPTEASAFTTIHTLSMADVEGDSVPIGPTLPNFQGYVLDQHLQALPVNLPGELCLSGPGVAKGYYRRPELTEQAFVQNPFSTDPASKIYKTGDIVKLRPDGTMEYLGRRDQQTKLRGIRIELGEIEAGLRNHPNVLDAITKVVEIDDDDARLLAWLVVEGQTPDSGQLESWLAEFLPDYMIPNQFLTIDQIPLNPNGKPDRDQLTIPLGTQASQVLPEDEDWTEMEGKIRHLWEDVLKCDLPLRSSHFFRSGGHSLLLTEMVAEVTRRFSVPLTLREAMDHPTVNQFAALVEEKLASGTRSDSIPRVSRSSRRTAGNQTSQA